MANPFSSQETSNDRISNLPDALIHRILSLLSTRQAVATSVLSKRWLWHWASVPSLDLQDSFRCRYNEKAKMKFVHFVYRVLTLNRVGSVEKFRLHLYPLYNNSWVNTLIRSATDRGLQEVDISVSETVKLPGGLFSMKTLKILKLHGQITVDVPVSVCLPSLKILHLLRVNYTNVESISSFISGCPSLEELHIDGNISPRNLNISSPTLNRLSLALQCFDFLPIKWEINTPALKYLNFSCISLLPHPFNVENFPCLIEANIYLQMRHGTGQIIKALNAVKYLKLDGRLYLLMREHVTLPLFVNLTSLELAGDLSAPVAIASLLQKTPKLQTLVVHNKFFGCRWIQPTMVPTCFLSSLSRARFGTLKGLEGELKMVKYFLKNAKVLRTMEIYTSTEMSAVSKLCFVKKISMFSSISETCQLSFN